ncbi:MAG: hypothetical protein KC435_01055 [Thermomicrobiales bacterium]|nr:hypothetical protein [Thermomicrobiales bacterium]
MNWFASRSIHHVVGVAALSVCLMLAACGGSDSSDPTPTATTASQNAVETQAPQPTLPPVTTPEVVATDAVTPTSVVSTSVATPTGTESTVATPVGVSAASPVAESTETPDTEGSTVATPMVQGVTSDNPGDGTGGSGMTERDQSDDEEATAVAATPAASPVAQLSVEGCEVPDVPIYSGTNTEVTLTSDVNFRSGPGTDCDPLSDEPLGEGQTVTVTGGPVTQAADGSEWIEVEVNGQKGWISTEFVEPAE